MLQFFCFKGCELNCAENERVHVDLKENVWECLPREETFVCPGAFELDCPNDPTEVSCSCKNQVGIYIANDTAANMSLIN